MLSLPKTTATISQPKTVSILWAFKIEKNDSHDQVKSESVNVESICHMSDYEQMEIIADNFSKISNDYDPIDPKQIQLDRGNQKPAPVFEAHEVFEYQTKIRTNTASVKDDIPEKIITEFALKLSDPMNFLIYGKLKWLHIPPKCILLIQ